MCILSKCAVNVVISPADACFAGIYFASADAEFGADFRLPHTVHITVQDCKFQCGEPQCAYKFVVFRIIGLFAFKAVYGIRWQSFIVREVYGFNDSPAPVWSITKKIDEVVYLTIARKFYGDLFSSFVFAVNFIGAVTDGLI